MFTLTVGISVAAVATAFLSYIISIVIYNLYFHPLSRFPGPPLWAAFQFPFLQKMLQGRLPYRVKELHDKYGSIVRISPGELSFIEPAAWRDIYMNKEFLRPPQWGNRPPGVEAYNLISAGVADHARFRKAIGAAFSDKAIRLQEPIINQYVDLLIEKLRQTVEENRDERPTVDVVRWLNFTTFDVISDLGWGESFNCLEKQGYHPWITVILQFQALLVAAALNYYPLLATFVSYITPKSALVGLQLVLSTSEKNVKIRLQRKTNRPDMMSYILSHNKTSPENSMSEAEMIANSMAIIVAGSETLTAALAGTINNLITHPKEMQILVREIRSAFESEEKITAQSTKPLAYLTAALQEGMRLCPPLPDNMHRNVPKGGVVIAGHHLPEGITVGIPCYAMFRSEANFTSPEEFIPERWLPRDELSPYLKDRQEAYHPFSMGPHGCLGQQLAWVELRVILARLLWNFDIEVPEGTKPLDWTSQNIFWAWDKKPANVALSLARKGE
ncbi:cytochrome P450 [Hyaloscypha variabilis F]|uniref:Cytochrome P450 n=1 Tax=Hyaloscypha variabilis (strain UAMH 11265 / GT02V1 / F) TaxID=1149755 RepID=A0A2J6S2T8_HYAVF|nr:cytochrome P450 [Hyaloscypha variabilis F]